MIHVDPPVADEVVALGIAVRDVADREKPVVRLFPVASGRW